MPKDTFFISYSRTDKEFVDRLINDLVAEEFKVWRDSEKIIPGTPSWDTAIRNALEESAAVVLVASPASRQSKVVQGELAVAKLNNCTVYPIWAAGDEWIDCVALDMAHTEYIDGRGRSYNNAIQKLKESLRAALDSSNGNVTSHPSKRSRRILRHNAIALLMAVAAFFILILRAATITVTPSTPLNLLIGQANPDLCPGKMADDFANQSWEANLEKAESCVNHLLASTSEAIAQQATRLKLGTCQVAPSGSEGITQHFAAYWALDHVAVGYFNLGLRLRETGNTELAYEAFQTIVDNYSCAWTNDTSQGISWSVGEGAKGQLDVLNLISIYNTLSPLLKYIIDAKYDLCNSPGKTGFANATWNASLEVTNSCVLHLLVWRQLAAEQQSSQTEATCSTPPSIQEPGFTRHNTNYWALDGIAIGFYNLGLRLRDAKEANMAHDAFQSIVDNFSCAWAYDPKGWFWSVSQAATEELNALDKKN